MNKFCFRASMCTYTAQSHMTVTTDNNSRVGSNSNKAVSFNKISDNKKNSSNGGRGIEF